MLVNTILAKTPGGRINCVLGVQNPKWNGGTPTDDVGNLVVSYGTPRDFMAGLGYDASGALCIASDGAPITTYCNGLAMSGNLVAATNSGAPAFWVAGLPVDNQGRLCILSLPAALFAANEPGFHYETYDPNSLLARRNRLVYSEQFDNPAYTKTNTTIVANADGAAGKIVEAATNTAHLVQQNNCSIGVVNTGYARLKQGERTWAYMQIGASGFAYFNLAAGVAGSVGAGFVSQIIPAADAPGYYDCTVAGVVSGNANFFIGIATGDLTNTYLGDITKGIYCARAHVEWNSSSVTASSYQLVTDWNTEYMAAALNSIGMWQDSTGSTPVTAVEQPVGLWLDTKQGLDRGPECVADGSFDGAPPGAWSLGLGVSIAGGVLTADATVTGTVADNIGGSVVVPGGWYEVIYTVVAVTAAGAGVSIAVGGVNTSPVTTTGTQRSFIQATTNARASVVKRGTNNWAGSIDNISVRRLPAGINPATQSTAGSRPTLSARYNLLTKTEQFDDAAWTKSNLTVTANAATAPAALGGGTTADKLVPTAAATDGRVVQTIAGVVGAGYVYKLYAKAGEFNNCRVYVDDSGVNIVSVSYNLSTGAVSTALAVAGGNWTGASTSIADAGGGWWLITLSFTAAVAAPTRAQVWCRDTGDATGGIYLAGIDLRTANDAALNQPVYQRVNTSSDYDTAGFIHRLMSTNHFMQTPSIGFSTVDKMTVWAGGVKQSDSAAGIFAELTNNYNTVPANNGSWYLAIPDGVAPNYGASSRGTAAPLSGQASQVGSMPAPHTFALVSTHDIAGDRTTLNVNNTTGSPGLVDKGTGNFKNDIVYLFKRGGTTVNFVGGCTSITCRGSTAPTDAALISSMLQYTAAKAGYTLPPPPPPTDPDAQDWANRVVANGGTYTPATLNAVSAFCISAKANGYWTKITRLNLICGDQLLAAVVPLKAGGSAGNDNPVNFVAGDYTQATGLTPNGSNKHLRTTMASDWMTLNSTHFAIYNRGSTGQSLTIGCGDGTNYHMVMGPENNVWTAGVHMTSVAYNPSGGFLQLPDTGAPYGFTIGSRTSATSHVIYNKGVAIGSSATTGGGLVPGGQIWVCGFNNAGVLGAASTAPISAYSIGEGLTAAEALAFSNDMQTFQVALGRAVGGGGFSSGFSGGFQV